MEVSLGLFIVCILTVLILTIYVDIAIYVRKDVLYKEMKFAFAVILLILVRMLFPFNFPFSRTIRSYILLPPLFRFLYQYIGNTKIGPAEIAFVIWIVGACVKLSYLVLRQWRYRRNLQPFILRDMSAYPGLRKIMQENDGAKLQVCVLPMNISPHIVGLWKPILVLPDQVFTEAELSYICQHEIEHYRNHDLWLKLFLELVLCVQWFNPIAYFLKRKLTLIFELSNDQKVIEDCDQSQRMAYMECIMKVAQTLKGTNRKYYGLSFWGSKRADLKVRMAHIMPQEKELKKRPLWSVVLQYAFIVAVLIAAFVFVPEAYEIAEDVQEETVDITKDNSYLLKGEEGYQLFVNGEYLFTLSPIPDEFKDLPVMEEEDME